MNKACQKFGFTLIELMVVIAVLAFLVTVSVIAYNNVRGLSRDSVRVVHATQIQTALRAYYRDQGVYPYSLTLGQPLVSNNITYMDLVPNNPRPVDGDCDKNADYVYTQDNSGTSYHLTFCLGEETGDLPFGTNIVTPLGFSQ